MILINIPLPTRYGWSYDYHKKLKKFLSKYNNIIYYPYISDSFLMDETKMPLNKIFNLFTDLSIDFINSNYEFIYKALKLKKIKKIILFDSKQGWKKQYELLKDLAVDKNYLDSIFYVVVHTDPSYIDLTQPKYEFIEYSEIPNLITVNNSSISLFKKFFVDNNLRIPNLYYLPNIIDLPKEISVKNYKTIFWSGRITNKAKNIDLLYEIVKILPDYTFYVPVQYNNLNMLPLYWEQKGEYNNLKYVITDNSEHTLSIARKCRFILSTAKCEIFGMLLIDSILNGSIGIIPKTLLNSYSYYLLPDEFVYNDINEIKNILDNVYNYKFNYYYGYYLPIKNKYLKDLENYDRLMQ